MPYIYTNEVQAFASAELAAVGAEANGDVLDVARVGMVGLFGKYTRDAAKEGAVAVKVQVNPNRDTADWHDLGMEQLGLLVAGSDVVGNLQTKWVKFKSTADGAETFVLFIPVVLAKGLRVVAKEIGDTSSPGIFECQAVLGQWSSENF